MKKSFWVSCKRLLYKAFCRRGLIPPLDSQHPPLGPAPATEPGGLLHVSVYLTPEDYGPKVN